MKQKHKAGIMGLRGKFIFGVVLIVLCVTGLVIAIGEREYQESMTRIYYTTACQVTDAAAGLFSKEQLQDYANMVLRYHRGELGEDGLSPIANSMAYQDARNRLNDLRKSMGVRDLSVFVFDQDVLRNYQEEADLAGEWNPVCYIMDSRDSEEAWLGSRGTIPAEFREDALQATLTGVRMKQIITEELSGYVLTADSPVLYSGETIAFIAAELPMTTFRSDLRGFIIRVLTVAGAATILLLLVVISLLARITIRPIQIIASETESFIQNHAGISRKLGRIRTHDEIQILAENVLQMETDLKEYAERLHDVNAERDRMQAELRVATQIQAEIQGGIFPAFPQRDEFDIYATMSPAREISSDFCDCFLADHNHLAMIMADVSEKSVSAAFFLFAVRMLLRNRIQAGDSPAAALSHVNERMRRENEAALSVTVWLAVLEISTGKGIAANAKHEHPAIKRKDGMYELVAYEHSPAVAATDEARFREHAFELRPGDCLYMYTDGVPEAANAEETRFGTDRMLAALNEKRSAPPRELIAGVRDALDSFVGSTSQVDDIAMMCLAYFGTENRRPGSYQSIPKESDLKENESKENESKESGLTESKLKENESKENESKESGLTESELKENESKESGPTESELEENESKENESKESGPTESELKENESKENESKESRPTESELKERQDSPGSEETSIDLEKNQETTGVS